MRSCLVLVALLAACVPKPTPPAPAVPAPVTPAPVAPAPTPAPAAPAPVAPDSGTSGSAASMPAAPAPAATASDVASQVNEAVAMLTTADPSRAQRALELLQGGRCRIRRSRGPRRRRRDARSLR